MSAYLLARAREYVSLANHRAEARHDTPGEYYMDGGQFEIMEDTKDILEQIDAELAEHL